MVSKNIPQASAPRERVGAKSQPIDEGARLANRSRVYAAQRLPEIVAEMKALTAEKQRIAEARNGKELAPAERRKLSQRMVYVAMRAEALRAERSGLQEHRAQARKR
jgi:hypothetical protein